MQRKASGSHVYKSLILLLATLPLAAQSSFFGAGVTLLAQPSPKPTGWAALAMQANQKARVYSYTALLMTPAGTHPRAIQTSVMTGVLTPLRSFGSVDLDMFGSAGVATGTGSSGSAWSGGGMLIIPLRTTSYKLLTGIRVLQTAAGGTQKMIEIGFGKAQP